LKVIKAIIIISCISAFFLDEKSCCRTSILCTHKFLYISQLFHLSILLSYLIFYFVCLTLSLADTPNTYAHTYGDTHTHVHTKKKTHTKKKEM